MTLLIAGLIVFLGIHTLTTLRETRQAAINRLGEGGYKMLYSAIALAGLVMIIYGFGQYRASGYIQVWEPPRGLRHLTMLLMWLSFIMLVAAYVPPGKIKATLKHPMLVAVKTWALAHLLVNGDLGSLILFGSLLAWAVYDRISVKRRTAGEPLQTVNGIQMGDGLAISIGTVLFGIMLVAHSRLIGVSVF
ncbi:MAG: NnrU family protein [Beijerinckiaceae bacterium]|nr:NnrU family protein [Beijerinckiaceae bacterium]